MMEKDAKIYVGGTPGHGRLGDPPGTEKGRISQFCAENP